MRAAVVRHLHGNTVGYLALFVALGGTSYAVSSHGGPVGSGAIHACERRHGGTLRVVKQGAKCRRREVALAWNQQGPAGVPGQPGPIGAQGPAGLPGSTGAAGEKGAAGATNVTVRTETGTAVPSGSWYSFVVLCRPGERAVGGGANYAGFGGKQELEQSYPAVANEPGKGEPAGEGETPNAWISIIRNDDGVPLVPHGYAVCVKP